MNWWYSRRREEARQSYYEHMRNVATIIASTSEKYETKMQLYNGEAVRLKDKLEKLYDVELILE